MFPTAGGGAEQPNRALLPEDRPPRRNRPVATFAVLITAVACGVVLLVAGLVWTGSSGTGEITPTSVTTTSGTSADSAAEASGSGIAVEATTGDLAVGSTTEAPETTTTEATSSVDGAGTVTATGLVDVSDVAAEVIDSVVTVVVQIDRRGPIDLTGSGSGIVLAAEGLIVTNAHVVDDASSIQVTFTDGSSSPASIVGVDTTHDLALLTVDAGELSPISLGTTEGLEVGEPVIAVGNPLGLEGGPSVTTGIVSAVGRVLEDADVSLQDVIQTDAAITEGSSGGALLDSQGRLIGVTTAVGVSSIGVEGIGFAIPVETVMAVVAALQGS